MDVGSINQNTFPAKLWRLVNNPVINSILWDAEGKAVVIDRQLFEVEILSPYGLTAHNADAFKTRNFSSLIRQLNLYGFKKAKPATKNKHGGAYLYFINPNFQREHPERVESLRRLTADVKARMRAGLNRGSYSLLSHTRQDSPLPFHLKETQAMIVAHNGTLVPSHHLIRKDGPALSPTGFASHKAIPMSLIHNYVKAASSANTVHFQQGLLANRNQEIPVEKFTFGPPNVQHQLGCCFSVFHSNEPNPVASDLDGCGTDLFSPRSFYQGTKAYSPENINTTTTTRDSHLDAFYQIADELMETPMSCLVTAMTPEECGNPASAMQADPLYAGAELGISDVFAFLKQQDYVLPVLEKMPEDDIKEYLNVFSNVFS